MALLCSFDLLPAGADDLGHTTICFSSSSLFTSQVSNADFARALLWQLVVVPDLKEALHLHEKGRDDEGPTELVQQPAFSEWKAASDR